MTTAHRKYRYAIGVTSQFLYCGLPLRLDSYSKCQFGCTYCFAKARGGNFEGGRLKVLDVDMLRRALDRIFNQQRVTSALSEFMSRRIPFHLGGMSDPFPYYEASHGVTKSALHALYEFEYPAVISTKGTLFSRDDYLQILKAGKFVIQFSVSTSDELLHRKINLGTPTLAQIFAAVKIAAREGVPTMCRIQPAIPGRPRDVEELIDRANDAGVKYVAVEHLKLAIENAERESHDLSRALGYDILSRYRASRAERHGREWILPVSERLGPMLSYRERAHARGMKFGAADTDLLFLSDGNCCCNGSDLLLPNVNYYKFTMNEAIKRGKKSGKITFESIAKEWRPTRSIKMFVNSNSRNGSTAEEHLRAAWNKISHGPSLTSFAGVKATQDIDSEGMVVYAYSEKTIEDYRRPSL